MGDETMARDELVGVVLAAGSGKRLRPLTFDLPKALCPVGGKPLLAHGVERLAPHTSRIAANAFHLAGAFEGEVPTGVHLAVEPGRARGTAGALGHLGPWIDGADVMLTNADAWFPEDLDLTDFVASWDRERTRLLCVETGVEADFGTYRYCGVALIPAAAVLAMPSEPAGLYEVSWAAEAERGRLDLVANPGGFVDCGNPADYLRANLWASGGGSVIDGLVEEGATVLRSVVWPGASVHRSEVLVDAVRTPRRTVLVRHAPGSSSGHRSRWE